MSLFLLVNAVALISLWVIYHYIVYPAFISPLSKAPNAHPTSSWLPVWIWWKRRTGYEIRSIFAAHQRHGPIVRLAPKELSVVSLEGIRKIYTAGFERGPWGDDFMNYGTRNLFTILEFKPHSARKRMLTHVWSKSYLHNSPDLRILSGVIVGERFLPVLDAAAQNSTPMNVLEIFSAAGADIMSAYLFGLSNATNFLCDTAERTHYFRLFQDKVREPHHIATEELEARCLSMCRAAEKLVEAFPSKPASSVHVTYPVGYAKLSTGISNNPSSGPPITSPELEVASEMFDSFFGGHEGVGIALTYLLRELSQQPALQASLRAECLTLSPPLTFPLHPHSAVNASSVSPGGRTSPADNDVSTEPTPLPSPSSIDGLPLLHAIVYETLRLHPVLPSPMPRVVPAGGTTIEGIDIPAGTKVSTNAFCMNRNEVWPEADIWRPERWMTRQEKGEKGHEEMRWFWTFGSGGRMCIGNHFIVQILKLLTVAIYTRYTTSIVDDEGIEQKDSFIAGPVGEKLIVRFHHVEVPEGEKLQ